MPDPKSESAKQPAGSPSADPCTVVIDAPLPESSRERLIALSPRVRVLDGASPANLGWADVLYFSGRPADPSLAPRLRWAQFTSAGIGSLTGTPLARSGLPVACASGAYSTTVAEMALALLLSLQRRLPRCGELQRARVWRGDMARIVGDSSRGRTVGIVGYGSIGREVARLSQALGMTVLACKRQPQLRAESHFRLEGTGDPEGRIPAAWYGLDRLADMLARCDAVVVTLPGSPLTAKRIGRTELAALPAHAFLVNVGRGSVIDEPALLDALRSGRLAGAGLDVFAEEPLPPESPFWTEPGVLLTPHIGSDTHSMAELAAEVLIENVRRDLTGEPLLNVVNFDLGY